jgi:hypothetical protein
MTCHQVDKIMYHSHVVLITKKVVDHAQVDGAHDYAQ